MSPRKDSLAAWLVRQKGLREGGRILAFVVTWGIAAQDLDVEKLKVEEYAEYWSEDVRTSYRDLARFRAVFEAHGFRDPGGLLAVIGGPEKAPSASVESFT